jgi:hypothetical protein
MVFEFVEISIARSDAKFDFIIKIFLLKVYSQKYALLTENQYICYLFIKNKLYKYEPETKKIIAD